MFIFCSNASGWKISVTLNHDYLPPSITWQKERACNVLISEFPAPSLAIYINLNNFGCLNWKENEKKKNKKIGIYIFVFVSLGPKLRNTSLYTDPFSPHWNTRPFFTKYSLFTSCLKAMTFIVDYSLNKRLLSLQW